MSMKSILLLSFFLLFSPIKLFAQSSFGDSMTRLMNDDIFIDGDASVVIHDLTSDERIFEYRSTKTVRPASVMKLLTSVVAYDSLGLCYTMETTLSKVSNEGGFNLYVKGEMDPLFGESDMIEMAASVCPGTVVDTLYADCSFCDSLYWGPGWSWDDNPYAYQPYLSPLMYCGGAVEVVVSPSVNGEPPHFSVTPKSSFYNVVNDAICGDTLRGKLTILRDWLEDSNVIRIKGNCDKEKKERLNMYRSADFFLAALVEKLDSMGVEVRNISFGRTPVNAEPLHFTRRLIEDVIQEALIASDNLCAESLLYHVAATTSSASASIESGCKVVKAFVNEKLGYKSGFNVADGSGLSIYNYLTADILMSLLQYVYSNPEIYYQIYPRLSLAGVNGTLKNRMKGTAAYKKVYAKTGTVKGVCTLAGFAHGKNGHVYAFVLLNSGNMKSTGVRRWQDKVCELLCR
jgi:D-alanyl-D-alanine carboxypeptidase/D-alanyl-D-alanine-endopeptidase (penicillin-binding protein 4)